jgi:hypothetical protein
VHDADYKLRNYLYLKSVNRIFLIENEPPAADSDAQRPTQDAEGKETNSHDVTAERERCSEEKKPEVGAAAAPVSLRQPAEMWAEREEFATVDPGFFCSKSLGDVNYFPLLFPREEPVDESAQVARAEREFVRLSFFLPFFFLSFVFFSRCC